MMKLRSGFTAVLVAGAALMGASCNDFLRVENPNTVTASGYTNLELWLHDMAADVEGRSRKGPAAPMLSQR